MNRSTYPTTAHVFSDTSIVNWLLYSAFGVFTITEYDSLNTEE